MAGPIDVVIAGTKTFALALFAPVTERAGSRPRIAPEPSVALTLCAQSSGVLVVEYEPRWLPALTRLRQERPALRVVAALAKGQESAALALGPLSIDAVPWNGTAHSVMPAIERAIGSNREPAVAMDVVAAPPAQPSSAAARSTPSLSHSAPVLSHSSPSLSQSAPTLSHSAPVLSHSSPSLSHSAPVLSHSAPVLSHSSPALSHSSPALSQSSPALSQSSPALSRSNPSISAGPPPRSVSAAAPAVPGAPLDLFTDLGATAATPSPASMAAIRALPPPRDTAAIWPATGPSAAEAELALRARLAGEEDSSSLRPVIDQVVAGLSTLERDVFTGGAAPYDAELIRHAAVLRLRAAAALATRPPPRTPVDSIAVAELLFEIDGVLTQVKALVDLATPELKPQLEAIRNALVREAVDFSEACHEIGTAELPLVPATAHVTGRAGAARVLSSRVGLDTEDRPEEVRRRTAPVVTLLIVLLLGGGYHAWNLYTAPPKLAPASYDGAPAGTRALVTPAGSFIVLLAGHTMVPAELERFKVQELRKGNVVREVGPGRWIIEPSNTGAGARP
jgi:hypothetical protein